MKTNTARKPVFTHEGGKAVIISAEERLRRSVSACLLWEDEFYEDGQSIAERIREGVHAVNPRFAADLAVEVRNELNLRHAPLLMARELARHPRRADYPGIVSSTISSVIQRADELAEFLSIYWLDGREKLSAQVKAGLAEACGKFDAYQFAKYDRDGKVKLRDVFRLVHPKPATPERAELYGQVLARTLPAPDTWEVALSSGADRRETWTRLLSEKKLGYLALLRNLRNMQESGVGQDLVEAAIRERRGAQRVLPFRYVAAARAAPMFERAIDDAMIAGLDQAERLPGKTVVLVDVSGSMACAISRKSDMSRMDAAAAIGAIMASVCESVRVFSFSYGLIEVPARRGMGGVDAIINSQSHAGTYLAGALDRLPAPCKQADRIVVITDEQTHDGISSLPEIGEKYLVNVASARNGVGYRNGWVHVDGFSEGVVRFIREASGKVAGVGEEKGSR